MANKRMEVITDEGCPSKIPNTETMEAIQEVARIKEDSSLGKSYTNVDEMIEEPLSDT